MSFFWSFLFLNIVSFFSGFTFSLVFLKFGINLFHCSFPFRALLFVWVNKVLPFRWFSVSLFYIFQTVFNKIDIHRFSQKIFQLFYNCDGNTTKQAIRELRWFYLDLKNKKFGSPLFLFLFLSLFYSFSLRFVRFWFRFYIFRALFDFFRLSCFYISSKNFLLKFLTFQLRLLIFYL